MFIRSLARRSGLKFVLTAFLAVALVASVSACGRKGPLELPEADDQM